MFQSFQNNITVVIPTSPIPAHPYTAILEETLASVNAHLPHCSILIQADGVRPEQEDRRADYEMYLKRLAHVLDEDWPNVTVWIADGFRHQAAMMKESINLIKTPLMLYLEHDTPLCDDKYIEWEKMSDDVLSGNVNSIRLHHYDLGRIHPEHEYLMLPKIHMRVPLIPTVQWSQRAHLTTVDFYRNRVLTRFSSESRTMIEDHMYEVIMQEVNWRGKEAVWESWRLAIYAPEGHIKRSRDLNGRDGGPKFEGTFHA